MTSTKTLRTTTIIPDALYIDREADRQLDAVIDEMGRPAYILVARQMGKTNLLLRMKRRREDQNDLALYIDLSSRFDTERDLFRAIVDNLADTIDNPDVHDRIISDRGIELEPNAEYDRHLRLFLTADRHARVIIILDEINSLVGHAYSDRILSQIRSMYFARANHPVYNKLTYVLSGVAEPTDLIKNRNVSPFNIGEKIYLNDFNRSEVALLLSKAHLSFGSGTVDAIFHWTNGNPRMTWDVCSALEDLQRDQKDVTAASVASVVQKLYLTRFDRPPIDHIRALAESDRQVHDALISLLYGKGHTLDDRARSKLYLAGITTASANEAPQIRNKVIGYALSEAWLSQVEAGKKGLLEAACKRSDEKNHTEAVSLFRQFIELDGGEANLTDIQLMKLGLSCFGLARLDEAGRVFEAAISKTRSEELRYSLLFRLATVKLLAGFPHVAKPLLEEVANAKSGIRIQAGQQMAVVLAAISLAENADRIIDISRNVLNELKDTKDLSDDEITELRLASYCNIGNAYRETKRHEQAQQAFRSARDMALPAQLPGLTSHLLLSGLQGQERRETLIKIARIVISERTPYNPPTASFAFKRDDMALLLSNTLELGEQALFNELLNIAADGPSGDKFATLVNLAVSPSNPAQEAKLSNLLRYALSDKALVSGASPALQLVAARGCFAHARPLEIEEACRTYLDIATRSEVSNHLVHEDLLLICHRLSTLVHEQRRDEAFEIISFARSRSEILQAFSRPFYALLVSHEMKLLLSLKDEKGAQARAHEILAILSPSGMRNDNFGPAYALVTQLRDAAQAVLPATSGRGGARRIGRNEFVTVRNKVSGVQCFVKYKRVAERIASGELELVQQALSR